MLGFENKVIITGYRSNQFNQFKKTYKIKNRKWKSTNIFGSLICADKILSKSDIISYFKENHIAEISIPKEIIQVDEIPLLGTGKLDYNKIKEIAI